MDLYRSFITIFDRRVSINLTFGSSTAFHIHQVSPESISEVFRLDLEGQDSFILIQVSNIVERMSESDQETEAERRENTLRREISTARISTRFHQQQSSETESEVFGKLCERKTNMGAKRR